MPISDFPDIRKACSVLSKAGFGLIIPREKGLVRVYVQFPEDYVYDEAKWRSDWQGTVAAIMRQTNNILHPYTMSYKYCDWFTMFKIGQRVCNKFEYMDRVFLAGDAVHSRFSS